MFFRDDELIYDVATRRGAGAALSAWFSENSDYAETAIGGNYRDSP